MKISKIEDKTDKEIINLVFTLISDYEVFNTNWGELLFGKELNLPYQHKNKIFSIWFSGSIDSIEDVLDQYDVLREQTSARELKNCHELLLECKYFTEDLMLVAAQIDKKDQICLQHFRNTLVHARVLSMHNSKVNLKFLNNETMNIERYRGTKIEFWEIWRERVSGSMDQFIQPLRTAFFREDSLYFKKLCMQTNKDFSRKLSQLAYSDLK